ncbi:MAG: hypothetical protein DMF69_17410 [Acidobacteria bacterium]|nr:MAG: hypothetical protein DMF69_17410 [Acidobacteriota bacterium]
MRNEPLAHKTNSTATENDERRTERVDAGREGSSSPVGEIAKGLRPRKTAKAKRGEREEKDYVMETPQKVLKVLEALEGRAFEPASINRVVQRTGFTQSFCRSALITLKQAGYAQRTLDGWIVGPKLARFASRITAHSYRQNEN